MAGRADAFAAPGEGGYPHDRLPAIDYDKHPAYRARPTMALRLRALRSFAKGLAIVLLRWMSDYEHLPKPPEGAARMPWFLKRAPYYALSIVRQRVGRLARRRYECATPEGQAVLGALRRDGVVAIRLAPAEKAEMRRLLAPWLEALRRRLADVAPAELDFDDNRLWIDPAEAERVYRWFADTLGRHGAIDASRAYLGRSIAVAHVVPQINVPENDFWSGRFADAGLPDPVCNYCHVDTAYGVTKMIVYLGEVGEANGPFSYVVGSHRTDSSFLDRLVRKANDYAGLSSTAPAARALFAALPRALRRKAAFGADLADDHPHAPAIVAAERRFTSADVDCILFDPAGIHRGGMIRSGEREVATVLFAEAG